MLRRLRSHRSGMAQTTYAPTLSMDISLAGGLLSISPFIWIQPDGKLRRLAKAGEVMVSLWADVGGVLGWIPGIDYRKWSDEFPNVEGGRVYFAEFDYGTKWYRITARHVDSGATVGKEFRTRDGATVEERDVTVLDRGRSMPASFEQSWG